MARRTSGCAAPLRHGPSSSPPSGWCHAMKRFIRTSWVIDVLRLVRAHNLVVAAAGVLAGGWIALGSLATPTLLVFAAAAAVGLGAAGNAVNDVWDADADRVHRRPGQRPLAAGRLSRGTALLAAGLGVAFVPLSLALPLAARYGAAYYLIALFAQLAVLLVASRLIAGKPDRNSWWLKGAMIVGIVALVAGRIA